LSSNDPGLHFALGEETVADLEIWWPSGAKQKFGAIGADQLITIREDQGIVRKGWPKK